MLTHKKILLAITGSIAAYKAILLVRLLVKAGAEVKVILTPSAKNFVSVLTLGTLSKNKVLVDLFEEDTWANHVALGRWADVMLIAPLSCNTLSKMASGGCDNLLLAVYLSATCPVIVAPAMDEDMWHHPSTKKNIQTLKSYGNTVLQVGNGELASGLVGEGRMAEPEEIVQELELFFTKTQKLLGKKVLITAGPTHEALDPVRFIANHSSGKMGYALAEAMYNQGAEVTLVSGPVGITTNIAGIKIIKVQSAEEMYNACAAIFTQQNIAILAAAVADYTPVTVAAEKIKKLGDDMTLQLVKTKDILKTLGHSKQPHQLVVGFALETQNEKANALQKLQTKNADMIVLNSMRDENATFGFDTNKVTVFDKAGNEYASPLASKQATAEFIVNIIVEKLSTMRKLFFTYLILIAVQTSFAQEIQSKVTVLTQQLPTSVNKQRFNTLQTQLTNLLNNRKWTQDRFGAQEKIECNFLLNITESTDQDVFTATLTVQSARPTYNSAYKAPMINYMDNDVTFKYVEFQPVEFNESRVAGNDPLTANLTATIAYYIYLILGFDYDSFSPKAGNPYFITAQNIVNNAPESRGISGWKAFDGQRNRYWLANNMTNNRFNVINDIIYYYYRLGLDKMYEDANAGRENMLNALTQMQTFNRENPNTMIQQFFMQSKYTEIVGVFKKALPDVKSRAVTVLQQIDPANADKYRSELR